MLTIIADSNIAHLNDYFNTQTLGIPINLIVLAGRDITIDIINKHQPDALLIRSVTLINQALLDNNHTIKFVGSATIGTDHVDQSYLAKRGITFANAAGCSKHSVAQYVISAILTLRPQYHQVRVDTAQTATTQLVNSKPPTIGIIGLGNIGSTLAAYAQDLDWQILGYDPLLPASDLNNASFDDVITQSDVVSLHVPLTTKTTSNYPTYHLINEQALALMPANTLLINSARGQVISEAALLAEFENAQTPRQREVVLDVFEHEPTVSAKLLNKLAIATPHIAGYTLEGKLRGTQMVFDRFIAAFCEQLDIAHIAHTNLMESLLPANPYCWQELKTDFKRLPQFYDIKEDDQLLRDAIADNPSFTSSPLLQTNIPSKTPLSDVTVSSIGIDRDKDRGTENNVVSGKAFDSLRKNYKLRREWLF